MQREARVSNGTKGRRGRKWWGLAALGTALLIGLFVVGVTSAGESPEAREVGYTELVGLSTTGQVATVDVETENVRVTLHDGAVLTAIVSDEAARHDVVKGFAGAGVPVTFASSEPSGARSLLSGASPALILLVAAGAFIYFQRGRGRTHFATTRGAPVSTTRFDDVAGMEEVKESLQETVQFLRDPAQFGRLGARAPRGVLLTGEPGTGKTLLARAVANEAGVPFLSCSGSSFQEMYVGVGASRVRSLFKEARELAPCIVFIDEIDAIARARGKGGDGASTDHDQTINQLLVEMDGFDHTSGVVVIASTNRPDVLDPAVVRPGRFDRQILVPLPDARGRRQILDVHAKPIDLHEEVDLAHVARTTAGFSGAELANLLNEAAILAARDQALAVGTQHIERARDFLLMGAERKGMRLDDGERFATAVHEAGHVAVGMTAANTDPVHKVSILPRGRALGITASLPEKERVMYTKEFLEDQICMMLGGRAAEMEILGTMTAGASDDIERATNIAHKMVAELGMSPIGPICMKGNASLPHSEKLLDSVEETTRMILQAQLDRAVGIVRSRRKQIDRLVAELLENDSLGRDEIEACFAAAPSITPEATAA